MSGLAAAFADETVFLDAVSRLRGAGLERIEAYTPYPVEVLDEILPCPMRALPAAVFLGGALSFALGFGLQWYGAAIGYPLNIGGRPLASWPAFIPIAFELTVLGAVLTAFFGFLILARLPRLYQPVAALEGIERASQDRFFLVVDARDARFDFAQVRALLEEFAPCSIEHWRP